MADIKKIEEEFFAKVLLSRAFGLSLNKIKLIEDEHGKYMDPVSQEGVNLDARILNANQAITIVSKGNPHGTVVELLGGTHDAEINCELSHSDVLNILMKRCQPYEIPAGEAYTLSSAGLIYCKPAVIARWISH